MNNARRSWRFAPAVFFVLFISLHSVSLAGQAKAAAGQGFNLYNAVMEHKETMQWKPAPGNAIPVGVCAILQICGSPAKFVVLPAATEGGNKVGRGLFLTTMQDTKHTEVVVLEHQTIDSYFFLVSPDGKLAKAAYYEAGKPWMQMGSSLAQPVFEGDVKAWQGAFAKLAAAPAKPAEPAQP